MSGNLQRSLRNCGCSIAVLPVKKTEEKNRALSNRREIYEEIKENLQNLLDGLYACKFVILS
jgi:hypothetical protein